MAPALKNWPLNLDLSAYLKAYNSSTKGGTDMGSTVIESSGPQLSCEYSPQLGTLSDMGKMWLKLIFTHKGIRYLKSDYTNVFIVPLNFLVYTQFRIPTSLTMLLDTNKHHCCSSSGCRVDRIVKRSIHWIYQTFNTPELIIRIHLNDLC